MNDRSRLIRTNSDSISKRFVLGVCLAVFSFAGTPTATADIFTVTSTGDAIPAPPGSLRWAIEQSELNGIPDHVQFAIDGGTINLVAPLPALIEGGLTIGLPDTFPGSTPGAGSGITIDGQNLVSPAIGIFSAGNRIGNLEFARFPLDVILIGGDLANDNEISRNVFGRPNATMFVNGTAVHFRPDGISGIMPSGNLIRANLFQSNQRAIWFDGPAVAPSVPTGRPSVVFDNWLGTNVFGNAGSGNGEAILAQNGGPVVVIGNRFSGPGLGVSLLAGSHDSVVTENVIGLGNAGGAVCSGFTSAALTVTDSTNVEVKTNLIQCSDAGVQVGPAAIDTIVYQNLIGGDVPSGHVTDGLVLDTSNGTRVENNIIFGNGGFGISGTPAPVIAPPSGNLFTCNSIFNNLGGAISIPGLPTLSPILTASTTIEISGDNQNTVGGIVEVFGDDFDEAATFHGTVRAGNVADPSFIHKIPVLDLMASSPLSGTALLSFDRTTPVNWTASFTRVGAGETSELAFPIASDMTALVFDVIRGKVENLGPVAGGVDLGPVDCLGTLDPDIVVSPDIFDPDIPALSTAFFYTTRRNSLNVFGPGSYDVAKCLSIINTTPGNRHASAGDCPP